MKRRSFIQTISTTLLASLLPSRLHSEETTHLNNPTLETIKEGYGGNVLKDGKFENLFYRPNDKSLWDVLKWRWSDNPLRDIKNAKSDFRYPLIKNNPELKTDKNFIAWLGHATFLIQIDGKQIITDPVLFDIPMIKRLLPTPIHPKEINPDYTLISHGHYDHLDIQTLEHFPNTTALVPLKFSKLIDSISESMEIQEAGWFQKYSINESFEIYLLPAHHWHSRYGIDRDEILWGSFLIKANGVTIYFAGDTAYSKHFKAINEVFGEIDYALMPVGAYNPRWFMKESHIDPQDSIQAFKELGAKHFIPMHYGTYDLTDEPYDEPIELLKTLGIDIDYTILDIGGVLKI